MINICMSCQSCFPHTFWNSSDYPIHYQINILYLNKWLTHRCVKSLQSWQLSLDWLTHFELVFKVLENTCLLMYTSFELHTWIKMYNSHVEKMTSYRARSIHCFNFLCPSLLLSSLCFLLYMMTTLITWDHNEHNSISNTHLSLIKHHSLVLS